MAGGLPDKCIVFDLLLPSLAHHASVAVVVAGQFLGLGVDLVLVKTFDNVLDGILALIRSDNDRFVYAAGTHKLVPFGAVRFVVQLRLLFLGLKAISQQAAHQSRFCQSTVADLRQR